MPAPKPVALVTGCSTGIGRAAAQALARDGFLVVATARKAADIADLAQPDAIECEVLDVTKARDRERAVARVLERHGRIDALVNNAGFGAVVAAEDTSTELLQRMFDTNLFGAHELARLVLPHMRKQGSGRIVNVSSVSAHYAVPMMSAYCATKFALRAMTLAMDLEVRAQGVRALLVEPGFVRTGFGKKTMAEADAAVDDAGAGPYARYYDRWARRRAKGGHGTTADVVARAIVKACKARRPALQTFTPTHAKVLNVAKRVLPEPVVAAGLRRYFL